MSGRISRVVASLVIEGLKVHAPEILRQQHAALARVMSADEDGVPLQPYRQILRAAREADGGVALLRAGEPLRTLEDPLLYVLLNTDTPESLIDKLGRLSRFIHSRHHVVLESMESTTMRLRHVAEGQEPPWPSESLASCGQHVALLEEIGCRGLVLRFPESGNAVVYADGRFRRPPVRLEYAAWQLQWDSFVPSRRALAGLDAVLLDAATHPELSEQATLAEKIARIVRRDLARTWKISDVARTLGTSARSLQRALAADGERYSDVVDRVRNMEAVRLLRDTTLTVTEIGYVCGFADGAHFSRSFKKRYQVTPTEFRSNA